jgi:flagellar biosynthetic protein FlhB
VHAAFRAFVRDEARVPTAVSVRNTAPEGLRNERFLIVVEALGSNESALRTAVAALSVILVLAALDALFQRLQHERDLRMTRAEVKEEHRLSEGDPHVRARIRAVQRELAMRRMMSDVPRATVVITNPTHYAVALRYDKERGGAPVVVAKGADHLAQRIKELARAAGVRCHEDVALARGLYSRSTVGQEIPAELYAAVAAVLATIYRMQEART